MSTPQSCTIYIVRHGETEANRKRVFAGHTDSPLTQHGIRQAQELADRLKDVPFHEAFSSDLLRARKTAEIIALEKKLIVQTTERIRERNMGKYQGRPYEVLLNDIQASLAMYEKLTEREKRTYRIHDSYESEEEMTSRFILFLREIAVAYPQKTLLVASHGELMEKFLIHIGYTTREQLPSFSSENCAYIILESDGTDFFIKQTVGIGIRDKS